MLNQLKWYKGGLFTLNKMKLNERIVKMIKIEKKLKIKNYEKKFVINWNEGVENGKWIEKIKKE